MIELIMLFWIGRVLVAPTWYWWCWGILVGVKFLSYSLDLYNRGKSEKE